VPEDVKALVRVGVDQVDVGVFLQAKIEPDDFPIHSGQDRGLGRLELREDVPEPGSFLHRENNPIDLDVHLISP
jgi:hypothetical protein